MDKETPLPQRRLRRFPRSPAPGGSRRNSPLTGSDIDATIPAGRGCTRRYRREGCCRLGFAIAGGV